MTGAQLAGRMELGGSTLDLDAGTLNRDGRIIDIRAKSFALLCYMAQHAGRVLTKAELIEAVWPDVIVTDDSLTQAVRDIRLALGVQDGRLLRTVARRGYMLELTPVRPDRQDTGAHAPRIAVLPTTGVVTETDWLPFVEVLSEEIADGLTRFRDVTVLSPRVIATADTAERDLPAIVRQTRADYLVEGSVQALSGGLRLSVKLVRAEDGALVWVERFNCDACALLTQQDIVRRIVRTLSLSLELGERARTASWPTENLTAYDQVIRGRALMRHGDPSTYATARDHFERAVAENPGFGLAYSFLAWAEIASDGFGLASAATRTRAKALAQKGVELAPGEARALSLLGYVQSYLGDYISAEANIRRALALNPSSVDTVTDMVVLLLSRGRPQEALDWLSQVENSGPLPVGHEDILRFEALFMLGRYDEAARSLSRVPHPDLRQRVWMAALAAELGRPEEVRRHLDAVAEAEPDWDHLARAEQSYAYEHAADRSHMLDSIRKALALWRGDA
ncbi:winged helix-turn-helix domain-containing tetratricopeptide repeat protein [Albidovulum sediminis]|uniref:Winged helix-turn-helix domain-containing protein n=1 Tax=Albidovulum sediminis TaxID=3066345 RepID=A0ABT2NPD7_9RHOB|nr:winged helix-turn-helix domain-containing protein [Defluviimonas sediminis]MCT8330803.1 winged helix-turn-helix domain-containing protein [Defluviimonas sediminis]